MTVHTDDALLERHPREHATRIIARVVDYLFGVIYTILLVRLVLDFLEARRDSGFYGFVRTVSDPFYAPFAGIIPSHAVAEHPVVWGLVVAIFAYAVVHALIRGLLRLVAQR